MPQLLCWPRCGVVNDVSIAVFDAAAGATVAEDGVATTMTLFQSCRSSAVNALTLSASTSVNAAIVLFSVLIINS